MASAELQFEQLTRELEAERKSVASQLERCKLLTSETASMSSISSTNDSFHWRSPQQVQHADDESETESKVSGSHLVDSCLRVLEDRGLMSNDNYQGYMPQQFNQQPSQTMMSDEQHHFETSVTQNYTYQEVTNSPHLQPATTYSPAPSFRDDPPSQFQQNGQESPYELPQRGYDSPNQSQEIQGNYPAPSLNRAAMPPYHNGPYGSNSNLNRDGQSPRPNDSFQGYPDGYNKYGYDETVTYATVNKARPKPPDQDTSNPYGSPLQRSDQKDYSGSHLNIDVPTRNRLPSDQHLDSPQSDRYSERGSQDTYGRRPQLLMPGLDEVRSQSPAGMDRGPPYDSQSRLPPLDQDLDSHPRMEAPSLLGAPMDQEGRPPSAQSGSQGPEDMRWRNPDLPEVIEYLSHHNDMVKANAAAYLQHLCYMDNDVKAKTRGLGGIPVLVELINSDIPEVHRAACGALKNLSYGRANEDNKKAIKNAGGIPALIRLLRRTPDNDVREQVTGILWNLSSTKDLKRPIIDDGLTVLVNTVIIPHSGWQPGQRLGDRKTNDIYWSTVFRNASGVLRNISSDGLYARTKLRECEGLVDAIVFIVQAAIGKNDIDNKSVENCVCVLRNLSYGCQEVQDPDYLKKRARSRQEREKGESTGCFGGSKKKDAKDQKHKAGAHNPTFSSPETNPQGMSLLWHPNIVPIYLPLLYDCTNPETLEAAAGAIQNLAACEWKPSEEIRETVRKQKGLPVLVELLNLEADRVVCAAATALRNLSMDPQSKDLIGKYAMKQLVQRLPEEGRPQRIPNSDETICAMEALIYEVIRSSTEFATSLLSEGGVERLMYIVHNDKFAYRVRRYASSVLTKMWEYKELQPKYREKGWRDVNFLAKPIDPRKGSPSKSLPSSAENTLNRPHMDQSGPTLPGYNENTLPYVNRQQINNVTAREQLADGMNRNNGGPHSQHFVEMPMTQLGPPPAHPPGYRDYSESPTLPRTRNDDGYSRPPDTGVPYSQYDDPAMAPPPTQPPGYQESPMSGGYYASVDLSRQGEGPQHVDLRQPDEYGQQGEYGPDVSYI